MSDSMNEAHDIDRRKQELAALATSAKEAAAFYEGKPGMVGSGAVIDLYRTIARLAALIQPESRS